MPAASSSSTEIQVGIVGGGPSSLYMFKKLISFERPLHIYIFEKSDQLGAGFPYSLEGANTEHITNVSGNEISELVTPLYSWVKSLPDEILNQYQINAKDFNEYKVVPRLLFGKYLEHQFCLMIDEAKEKNIKVDVFLKTEVSDIIDRAQENKVCVTTTNNSTFELDKVIICSGHNWPKKHEDKIPGYFDSPYPPSKLSSITNRSVAIRGSSLTAIDAIRTLAKANGHFLKDKNGELIFAKNENADQFKISMFSRNGLLPAVRFHLDDSHLSKDDMFNEAELNKLRKNNNGFLSLDYVFETKFKKPIKEKAPGFYAQIEDMNLETFINKMMDFRKDIEPFNLLEAEYKEAAKSIRRKESVYWKEMLAVLSFVMNYPAKYFSAEDTLRLQKVLMPLISVVIAFVPQSSVEELIALYKAKILTLISVDDESSVEPVKDGGVIYRFKNEKGKENEIYFSVFIDCIGQPHLSWKDLPYKSLVNEKKISRATVKFADVKTGAKEFKKGNENVVKGNDGNYYLNVAGISINDYFQLVDESGNTNDRIFMMAVPYIGGFNPDYSGLDFGEAASTKIVQKIFN